MKSVREARAWPRESPPRPLAPSPRLPLTCRAPPAPRRRRELPPCPNSLPPPAETRNSPPTAIVSSAQLRSRSEPHLKKSSTGSVDASEPAMGQSDALFWCATRYWFVVAGDAVQFRGAHRQLSTTCQTAAPAKRASPGHITHTLYTQPNVKRRTLLLLCFLCPPLACAMMSQVSYSPYVSLYYSIWSLVCLSSMVAGSMMVMHS